MAAQRQGSTAMRRVRHVARIVGGFLCIAIGIVGLILPIMPGWVFIIPGMMLLGFDTQRLQGMIDWGERKLPSQKPAFERLRNMLPSANRSNRKAKPSSAN